MSEPRRRIGLPIIIVFLACAWLFWRRDQPETSVTPPPSRLECAGAALSDATTAARLDKALVSGVGEVVKILPDDEKGIRHQRFLVKVAPRLTILVAHNIDIAPKLAHLAEGERISFCGEYIWNNKGGVLHWTHHDPRGRHPGGWLRLDNEVSR